MCLYKLISIYNKFYFMNKKVLINLIKEEISDFDFLGNEEYQKERVGVNLLKNEDFQKLFICDSLLRKNDKIKLTVYDATISGNWDYEPEDATYIKLEYFLDVEYKYDQGKEPVKFGIEFRGDNIPIRKNAWRDHGSWETEPSGGESYEYISWGDIGVKLLTEEGDEIKFIAFERAPEAIQTLFIREYTEDYIENNTMEINTKEKVDNNAIKTSYC